MNAYAIFALIAFVSYLALGFMVLLIDQKKPLHQIFFIYSIFAAIYSFSEFGYLQATSYDTVWIWIKARSIWPFTFAAALHFHLIFTRRAKWLENRSLVALLYLPAFIISAIDLFTISITGLPIVKAGIWSYSPPSESIMPWVAGGVALSYMLLMIFLVVEFYANNPSKRSIANSKAFYILVADFLVSIIVVINTFLQHLPDFEFINVDSALLLISNAIIAFAIKKFSQPKINSEEAYNQFLSNISEFVMFVDSDGRISKTNEYLQELTGFSKEELEEKNLEDILYSPEGFIDYSWFGKDRPKRHTQTGDIITTNQEKLPIKFTSVNLAENGSKVLGQAIIGKLKLDGLPSNLNQPALFGKGLLPQKELDFLRIINHHLMEGTRIIHLCSQLINQDKLEAVIEEELLPYSINGAEEKVFEILDLHRKSLAFVKEEALFLRHKLKAVNDYVIYGAQYPIESVDLKQSFETALQAISKKIEPELVKISLGSLPSIQAYPEQIIQLFKQLLSNAIKFKNPEELLHIQVSTIFQDMQNYIIEFRDNGIGIRPEYHKKVFNLFEKLHAREKYPGTGLGLALCKKIVEVHNGSIWIDEEVKEGTSICIAFPRM